MSQLLDLLQRVLVFLKILKTIDNLNSDPIIKSIINSVNKDQIENKEILNEARRYMILIFSELLMKKRN